MLITHCSSGEHNRSEVSVKNLTHAFLHTSSTLSLIVALALGLISGNLNAAENFSLDTISLAYTNQSEQDSVNGRGTIDENKMVLQYEHFGINDWGFLYADFESSHGKGVGALPQYGDNGNAFDHYAWLIPAISLTKATGKSFTRGPLSDIAIIGSFRASSYYNYRSWGLGVSASFEVPGFIWFETSILSHDSDWAIDPNTFSTNTGENYTLDRRQWLWRTYLISKPIRIGSERFHLTSFTVLNGTGNKGANDHGTAIFQRLDLTWEILGHSDFQLGLRYEYVSHKNDPSVNFGKNRYESHVPSLVFKYVL